MKHVILFFCLSLLGSTVINAQTYPEVWFENSNLPVRYSNSTASYHGDSWIKNRQHQLPVSDSIFFTPNNALELNYTSAKNGGWSADIQYVRARPFKAEEGAVFSFKLFIQSKTALSELPGLVFIQADSVHSSVISLKKFVRKIEHSDWVSVEIPLREVEGIHLDNGLHSIRLLQNSTDGKEHRLFIDQIEVLPLKVPRSPLTSAAVLAEAVGFERHVDLTWTLPFTPSIRYIKVYRSEDNEHFKPVAIRPVFVKKYSDIVPEDDETYFYKISWVDYKYQESPLSNALEAKTRKLSDEELLKMVQKATVSYFIDGEEFNSGMQLKNITTQNSLVSIKNTGAGILALISEVKEDFEAREKLLKRLEKIVSFLERAEQVHGVFPELLNGRTGKSSKNDEQTADVVVDLESTGILMQALLVAKEYFGEPSEVERQLRNRIERLWRAVEWNAFVKEGQPYLFNQWSTHGGLDTGSPLSGLEKRSLYLMALASPEFNIELDAYQQVLLNPLKVRPRTITADGHGSLLLEGIAESQAPIHPIGMEYYTVPYVNMETYYGIPLAVGSVDDPLDEILMGFMALDPRGLQDAYADYYETIKNLIHIQYRKALEENIPLSLSSMQLSNGIAIYPFDKEMAMRNIRNYYVKHAETLWTEYGFVRAIDYQQNKIIYPKHDFENALNTIMINNGESGYIWKLFSQDPAIKEVLEVLFKK